MADLKTPEQEEQAKEAARQKRREEERLKKEAAAKIPQPQYFDVKVECMVPAILTFRVLALDPEEALRLSKSKSPHSTQYKLANRKDQVVKIYDGGTTMLRWMKRVG